MKRVLILFLLFVNTFIFSETLQKVEYRNGIYTAKFKENKKIETKETFNRGESVLTVDFTKLNVKNNIPQTMKINDQYLESITITEVAGISSITFYMKKGIEYTMLKQNKEIKIMFSKSKSVENNRPIIYVPEVKQTPKKRYTIVVDAGHGGRDSGAVGNGYREKDIALDVSLKLAANLRKDFNVILTRSTDIFIPLKERAEIGNRANADLFVSIHLNSSKNSTGNGAEVFYFSRNASKYAAEVAKFENSFDNSQVTDISFSDFIINDIFYKINQEKSAEIAVDVLDSLINNFNLRRRGVFGANFAVLRESKMPSILVELGFMSYYSDVSQFVTSSAQERAAAGIANAIRKHFD